MRYNNYESVEVLIAAGSTGTRFYFPDLPHLRYVSLNGIETFNNSDCALTPTGATTVADADVNKGFLVIYANERESIFRIPLNTLRRLQASGGGLNAILPNFAGQKVVFPKSYIQLSTAPTATTRSFLFGIYYE